MRPVAVLAQPLALAQRAAQEEPRRHGTVGAPAPKVGLREHQVRCLKLPQPLEILAHLVGGAAHTQRLPLGQFERRLALDAGRVEPVSMLEQKRPQDEGAAKRVPRRSERAGGVNV